MYRVVCLSILLNEKVQRQGVAMMRLDPGLACFELLSRLLLVSLSNPCRHPIRQSASSTGHPSPDIQPLLLSASSNHDYLELGIFYLLEGEYDPMCTMRSREKERNLLGTTRLELNAYPFPFFCII